LVNNITDRHKSKLNGEKRDCSHVNGLIKTIRKNGVITHYYCGKCGEILPKHRKNGVKP
jgi:hypothetical protein